MPSYSPFDKPLGELNATALAVLREIPESWHVEYKQQINDGKTLAKSISALANTYGGWLIIGAAEQGAGDSAVREFPGLGRDETAKLQQRLGESINAHLQPVPHYDHRELNGPCEAISLEADRSIVVVHVPMSVRTPHIHSDGRVYERVGDTSQPRPISDRSRLDELYRRGDQVRTEIADWVNDDPEFSTAENEIPYLRLLLLPDPWNRKYRPLPKSLREFSEVLHQPESNLPRSTFDSVYTTNDGYVARQIVDNDPRILGLTLRIRRDYSFEAIIPLNTYRATADGLRDALGSRYEHVEAYIQLLEDKGYWRGEFPTTVDVVDLNRVLNVFLMIAAHYRSLLGLVTADRDYHFKARVLQAWRKVPFLDALPIIDKFSRHGVPTLLEDEITIPPGSDPDSFKLLTLGLGRDSPLGPEVQSAIGQGTEMFLHTLSALGISDLSDSSDTDSGDTVAALIAAANRGIPINYVGSTSSS